MDASARLEFEVPIDAEAFRAVRRTVESHAADRGFSEAKVRDLSLALCEALFNAMEHGTPGRGGGAGDAADAADAAACTIRVTVESARESIAVGVEDAGCAGDEARFAELSRGLCGDPCGAPGDEQERGRGLFLIRSKADEVRVERLPSGGSRVVLVKRR